MATQERFLTTEQLLGLTKGPGGLRRERVLTTEELLGIKRPLPAGIKPNEEAGAGRGTVNPPMVKPRAFVPDATAGSVARDVASGVMQIGPTALQGIAKLGRWATNDAVGKETDEAMQRGIESIQESVGSERGAAQRENFRADMADDSVSIGEALANNKGALADMILPTIGSMFVPIGAAGAAGKLVQAGKAAAALDKTALAARVAQAQTVAGVGATAAQNAAATFTELIDKGHSPQEAYIASGITIPFSLVAGRLTGGGAEVAAARALLGSAPVRQGAKQLGKAMTKEGAQEVIEEAGGVAGEGYANGGINARAAGKQLAVAGTLGAVMGGGVDVATQVGNRGKPPATPEPTTQPATAFAAATETGDVANRVAELEAALDRAATAGAVTPIKTPGGKTVAGQYALMEADAVRASHDVNLQPNASYPQELGAKDRSGADGEGQVADIVRRIDPTLLGASDDADTGAPVVGPDGAVESGNTRTIALQRIYQANGQKAEDYRQHLRENAEALGLDPSAVDAMRKPVLVRQRDTVGGREAFVSRESSGMAATSTAAETVASPLTPDSESTSGAVVQQVQDPMGGTTQPTPLPTSGHQTGAASKQNDLPEPTKAQILAGNAKLAHIKLGAGSDGGQVGISIESPAGAVREDKRSDPPKWRTPMKHGYSYGYFKGSEGADSSATERQGIDVFVREDLPENWSGDVFVLDQLDPKTRKFDEHKVMVGPKDEAQAERDYLKHYEKGWKGAGAVTRMSWQDFQDWRKSGKAAEPVAESLRKPVGLRVGITPNDAEAVTVRDGVVHIGKNEAISFETGDPVTVRSGATDADIAKALREAGALSRRQKLFGFGNVSKNAEKSDTSAKRVRKISKTEQVLAEPAPAEAASAKSEKPASSKPPKNERLAKLRAQAWATKPLRAFLGTHGLSPALASEFAPGARERRSAMVSGYGPIFRKTGKNLDELAQAAREDGFLRADEDVDELYERIAQVFGGERVAPMYAEGVAEAEFEAREREYRERMADEPPESDADWEDFLANGATADLGDFSADELTAAGYDAATPEIKAEVDALIALAEERGIDHESLRADAARQTNGQTEQEYYERAKQLLERATASVEKGAGSSSDGRSGEGSSRQRPSAKPSSRTDRGQADGDSRGESSAEGLTRPTRGDVEAKQDRAARAAELDAKAQIDREVDGFSLQSQSQERRTDTTTDLFGGPSVEDARRAVESKRAKGSPADSGQSLFSRDERAQGKLESLRALAGAARARLAAQPGRMAVADAQKVVARLIDKWPNGPQVTVVQTADELPVPAPADVRGLYWRNQVWVVAGAHEANAPGKAALLRTLAHEAVAHYGLRAMLADDFQSLLVNIQIALRNKNKGLLAIRDYVRKNYVNDDGSYALTPDQEADEIAAKVMEDSIGADGELKPGYGFLKRFWAKLAEFLRKLGITVPFTQAELQGLLVASQRHLEAGTRTRGGGAAPVLVLDGAAARTDSSMDALAVLSTTDDLFALPKSAASDIETIVDNNDPEFTVKRSNAPGLPMYVITLPDGTKATMTVRDPAPGIEPYYGIDYEDGEMLNVVTDRPGQNAEAVEDMGDVWIDVSKLKPGQNGAKIYNIAATFAHNTGRIFIGDPNGLSKTALRRRLEQMISSALKFGTTSHIAPHPDQIKGGHGVPGLRWVYGDHVGNIERMIAASVAATDNALPAAKNLSYELDNATFKNAVSGGSIPRGRLRNVLERSVAVPAGDAGGRKGAVAKAEAGWRTLARRAVFASLLEVHRASREGRGILDGLVRQRGELGAAAAEDRIFYARGGVARLPPTIAVDGVERPTQNSKGQPIHPTESGVRNFWRWFGQSKVVDEQGRPLVMYHGTNGDFDTFDRSRSFKGPSKLGFWLTNQADFAENFGDTLMPAFVALKNPKRLTAGQWDAVRMGNAGDAGAFSKLRDAWQKQGHDGVLVAGKAEKVGRFDVNVPSVIAAFDANQIKSATGNAGDFSSQNDSILFARSGPTQAHLFAPQSWALPDATRTDKIIYELQDGRIDLKRAQEAITKALGPIEEKFDARLTETLYPGRVARRTERFLTYEVKPMLAKMARMKVSMDELGDYLIARHAPERNKQIAKVNPDMPDGGAGSNSKGELMTTSAARAYLDAIPAARRAQLDDLAKSIDKMTAGTRKMLVTEGLEKQSTIDAWQQAQGEHYVPLHKDEAELGGAPHPIGAGFSVKGSASKRAMGSTAKVDNVLAHILMQREAAITRAEKNRVGLSLYGLAMTYPNRDFWTTIRPSMSAKAIAQELDAMGVDASSAALGMEGAPTIRTVDEKTGQVVTRPNPLYKNQPGAITLRVNGEDRVLMLNTQNQRAMRLADNLKNLDGLTHLDMSMSYVGKVTRWLAAVNTQYNPAFGLVNFVRDSMGALVNLTSTPLRGRTLSVLANVPQALAGIAVGLRQEAKGNQASREWARLWEQFQEDGGRTGYREMFKTADDRAKAVQTEINAAGPNTAKTLAKKGAWWALGALDGFNTTLENAVRLAAYKEALDKGLSRAQSARLGRELTVDFNRKGRATRELQPLYAFLNASIQGTSRTLEALRGPRGKTIMAGGLALGAIQALALLAADYDEDELDEQTKTRNLIIPLGRTDDGKPNFIKVPLALGLHVLPNTGRVLTELSLRGGRNSGKAVTNSIGEIMAAFNPLGGGNVTTGHGFMTTLLPTVLDPVADLTANKNFAGRPIEREPFGGDSDNLPGYTRAREQTQRTATGQGYMAASKAINTLTGGNEFEKGMASPTPERIRYIAQVVGGGVLRELEKTVDSSYAGMTGQPVRPTGIPLLGRFYGEVDDAMVTQRRYFEMGRSINRVESSLNAAEKAGNGDAMSKLADTTEAQLIRSHNRIQREIAELNRSAAAAVGDPETLAIIDEARTDRMRSLTETFLDLERERDGPTPSERIRDRINPNRKAEREAALERQKEALGME